MLNNKGIGKYEILTVFVMMMALFSFGGYVILKNVNKQKYDVMKNNASSFAKAITTNISSFHHVEVVYLDEAIDEEVFPKINNPFGKGSCDGTQSRVDTKDGVTYTTLKCGDYLIDNATFDDLDAVEIFKVSDWSLKKPSGNNFEKRELYNCLDGGKEIFDDYYDELFFVYEYNKKYGTDHYYADTITDDNCEVVSKEFYRTYGSTE